MAILNKHVVLGGLVFDDLSMNRAVEIITAAAKEKRSWLTATPNAVILHHAFHDPTFFRLLSSAEMLIPDGIGVIFAAKRLQTPFAFGRLAGVELGLAAIASAAEEGIPVLLFGGRCGIAERARERLTKRYPKLRATVRTGYGFSLDAVVADCLMKTVGLVILGLGSPLQEEIGRQLADRLSCPVLCLGGSLDVYAGEKKRCPKIVRTLSLEWAWRIAANRRFDRLLPLCGYICDIERLKKQKKSCNYEKTRL